MSAEKIVTTACSSHCGGACILKVHVRDGVITRIETDDGKEPQMRACLRCRAYRQRVYHPDRLLYPLKRVGKRGEGKFQRISWGEALDTVASEIIRVRDTYGPAAILFRGMGGDLGWLQGWKTVDRLLCLAGGFSEVWGFCSFEGGVFASFATYGTVATRSTRDDLLNSRLIIMWGWDPATTVQETNTAWYLAQAREAGARIISIDPRFTDSTATFAHQWIPIRPGTDAAMMMAMAYVMLTEELQDQVFLDRYTLGFEKFRDYVLGDEDGVPKTPEWAQEITGVPAATIESLAREYATLKPAALIAGISPGRTAYGEQYHRAAITLTAMAGNIGVHGGDAAARSYTAYYATLPFLRLGRGLKRPLNPVEEGLPPRKDAIPPYRGFLRRGRVNITQLADAILKGKAGGYPADYKLLYLMNVSYPNQYPNVNKALKALKALEFVVMHEQFLTPGAKFADILLPQNTFLERNDITLGEATGFYGYMNKVIDSLGESRSPFEICIELAKRLGISDFSDLTEEGWLREVVKESPHLPDYDAFKERAVQKVRLPEPYVAFRKEIEDPEENPFPTPSGKIEIYSPLLADLKNPRIPPVPKYIETWESVRDPLSRKYPLQLITSHFRRRAHSQFDNIPALRQLQPQALMINPLDAAPRGISDGDTLRVFNDRGEVILPARVTERIMPGVVDLPQGAWYAPDEKGRDRGGCANVLTRDQPSPGGALPTNTTLVQMEKLRLQKP